MAEYFLKSLAAEIEFDVEDFIPLINLFIDTTDLNLIEISSAAKQLDSELISSNIHNIKGASMNLGLNKISEIMSTMSKLNKTGFFADIEARVEECKVELKLLRQVLEIK